MHSPNRPTAPPHLVCIVQDVEETAKQQTNLILSESKSAGLNVAVEHVFLQDPEDMVLDQLTQRPVDWLLLDLLISGRDSDPLFSAGLNLLRRLRESGMFHGYQPRDPARSRNGVRCVGIYSATLAGFGGKKMEVRDELQKLGVNERHLYASDGQQMRAIARAIVSEVAGNPTTLEM